MPQSPDPVTAAARRAGVDAELLRLLVNQESGGNPTARSPKGAYGLAQLMPGTARALEQRYKINTRTPQGNLLGGAYYLREQLDRFKRPDLALSAYNSGPAGSEASGRVEGFRETQDYVRSIMSRYKGDGGGASAPTPAAPAAAAPSATAATPEPADDPRRALLLALLQQRRSGSRDRTPILAALANLQTTPAAQDAPAAPSLGPPGQSPANGPERGRAPSGATLDSLLNRFGLADAVTSGDRPGAITARGGRSDHSRPGRARDVNYRDPDFPRLVAYAEQNPAAFKDFLYSGLPWFIDEGRRFPISQLNKTDRGNHRSHAHVSVR